MTNAYPALDADDHDHADVCHYPGRTAYSCHLCPGRCVVLGGLCGANGSDQCCSDANFGLVVGDTGLGTPLEARSPMSTGLEGMKLKEEGEGLEGLLAGGPAVVDPEEQNCCRLAGS